jgi:hypothetical protein
MKYTIQSFAHASLLATGVFLAQPGMVLAQTDTKGTQPDVDAQERVKRQADSPFRFIIMNSKINRVAQATSEPPKEPTKKELAKSAPVKPEARTAAKAPEVKVPAAPVVTAKTPASAQSVPVQDEGKTVAEIFDIDNAKLMVDGSLGDSRGGFILPTVFTYSEKKPIPATAKFAYEPQIKKVRVDYKVPESVGYFGGAGVKVYAPGDGLDMSELVDGDKTSGLLVIELGSNVNNRLKIAVIGPKEQESIDYPFFILPVEKGVRTYGLELADFRQPPWSSTAPNIQQALKRMVGVSIEYARGNANGMADEASFFVGSVRIDVPKDSVAAVKK